MSPAAEPGLTSRLARAHLTSQLGESLNKEVVLACWVRDVRVLGAASFVLLSDMSAIVQVTAPRAKAPAVVLKEISGLHQEVIPSGLEVVSRAETPLPLDPRGIQKTLLETRLSWWVLDFGSEESNAIFKVQSKILESSGSSFFNHTTWRFSRR